MKKPVKPKKPKKPSNDPPSNTISHHKYIYQYYENGKTTVFVLMSDADWPIHFETEEEEYDFYDGYSSWSPYKINISDFKKLIELTKQKEENVYLHPESDRDGYLKFAISWDEVKPQDQLEKELSEWNNRGEVYKKALAEWEKQKEEYEQKKLEYEIWQAEQKITELKAKKG